MMPVDYAIARTRLDLTVGSAIRFALLSGAVAALFLTGVKIELVFVGLAVAWVALAYRTAVGTRLAAESPALIASGRYDEAEQQIELAVRSFIPSRAAKLTNLHHLATLRYAQGRWREAVELCQAMLQFRSKVLAGLFRSSRLMLAGALLETGDVRGAFDAIAASYAQRLNLSEAVELLALQLDYQWRVGAWDQMMEGIASKVQMVELLPAGQSARAFALLALAAHRTGHADWKQFLRRRAELLGVVKDLIERRSVLSELWPANGKEVERPVDIGTNMNGEAR